MIAQSQWGPCLDGSEVGSLDRPLNLAAKGIFNHGVSCNGMDVTDVISWY